MPETTREPQYQRCLDLREIEGLTRLGLMSNQTWHDDPRRLVFVLARYKFVAKMLSGRQRVLEVGCADAFGTRIVQQEVKHVTVTDFDPIFIKDVQQRADPHWPLEARVHDILEGPVPGEFDGGYALDVLEHIPASQEDLLIGNMAASLTPAGVLLIGTPSLQSQAHASAPSKEGHVNCKDAPGLRALMLRHLQNVFIFSMNDEVVHTGFHPMANYLFALACSKKQ